MSVLWFIPLQVSYKMHNVWVWVLYCLMTSGLNKDIQCHVSPYSFPDSQITRSDIRPQVKLDVNLMTADGQFLHTILCGYGWVKIRYHPKSCIMFGTLNLMVQIRIYHIVCCSSLKWARSFSSSYIDFVVRRELQSKWIFFETPFIEMAHVAFNATLVLYSGMNCLTKCTLKFDLEVV